MEYGIPKATLRLCKIISTVEDADILYGIPHGTTTSVEVSFEDSKYLQMDIVDPYNYFSCEATAIIDLTHLQEIELWCAKNNIEMINCDINYNCQYESAKQLYESGLISSNTFSQTSLSSFLEVEAKEIQSMVSLQSDAIKKEDFPKEKEDAGRGFDMESDLLEGLK